ncbi:PIN domain-containing protein [Yersinia aldovae]|uniref:PIN domain-containing protein n=1 Tax=Yersinia aldovae TaxID=29483 RepID=UPI0011A51423|nr:PIN domain-containing protein [Yersinia aldovae]
MKQNLVGRLAFIDTSAFKAKNYQFHNHSLKKLRDYSDDEKIRILTTSITISEVRSHFPTLAKSAIKIIEETRTKAKILRNLPHNPINGIFDKGLTEEVIISTLNENFENFLGGDNIEIVSLKSVDSEAVFHDYFEGNTPFSIKKKDEFPDAFALHAIKDLSQKRGYPVYIVSTDGDMKNFCDGERLIYLDSIDVLIDLIVRNDDDVKEPVKLADDLFDKFQEKIIQRVSDNLLEASYTVDNEDTYDVKINEVMIEGKNIIELDDDSVTFEVELEADVEAATSEPDYDRSAFDPEDQRYIFTFYNVTRRKFLLKTSITVTIWFSEAVKAAAELGDVEMESSFDLDSINSQLLSFEERWFD